MLKFLTVGRPRPEGSVYAFRSSVSSELRVPSQERNGKNNEAFKAKTTSESCLTNIFYTYYINIKYSWYI